MRFHDSTSLVTNGYWAPEYVNNGDELTLKYDIYSFGIVMLELITGCKPIEDSSLGPQRLVGKNTKPVQIYKCEGHCVNKETTNLRDNQFLGM
ncbi:unnamed protein product [Brassica rapa]|uniref:Protein kinase domain-containing protein n=2 Tax=Brassica TaxID=3705 RepID=A0A8D9HZ10_BRACM|nr:unnamed protein product [Brassica napus]CAG7907442.1 unnamed protein product [Brassica rapa]